MTAIPNSAAAARTEAAISRAQVTALQTLYSQWSSHTVDEACDQRSARLAWASETLGRKISSFKNLTSGEAYRLVNVLKVSLGQSVNDRPRRRRIRSRDLAQAAGTAGRRNEQNSVEYMVRAEDLARIEDAISRLGWTRERFDAWLGSSSSPLRSRPGQQIRTLADANRVWWAMKAMLKQTGRWRPEDKKTFTAPNN